MKKIYLLFLLLLLSSCASRGPIKTLDIPKNEVLVIGKIQVMARGKDITQESEITFKQDNTTNSYTYRPDETGLLVMSLPIGKITIAKLAQSSYKYRFDKSDTSLRLSDPSDVHYIGNLRFDWDRDDDTSVAKVSFAFLGIVGALATEFVNDGVVILTVENKPTEVVNTFNEKYNSVPQVIQNLLNVHYEFYDEPDVD